MSMPSSPVRLISSLNAGAKLPKIPLSGGTERPDNRDMEARVAKLEEASLDARERLTRMETKLDAVATKAELHDLKAELIKWALVLAGASIGILGFIITTAAPKNAPVSAQATAPAAAPIIFNFPPGVSLPPTVPALSASSTK